MQFVFFLLQVSADDEFYVEPRHNNDTRTRDEEVLRVIP